MTEPKHIVQFSGGKDSTCMLLMMLEKGMPIDEIIFCDTGMEFPQMYEHIDKVEQYIGRPITRIKASHSYEWYMFEAVRKRGSRIGLKGFGWTTMQNRWCTGYLKINPTRKYKKGNITYIGIAYDEPKRHENIPANIKHPLFDWKVTEKMALSYCKRHSFNWGGLYEKFRRVSCWCCPLQPISELRVLYHEFPALWEKLKEMDNRSIEQFKGTTIPPKFKETYSVQDLENKFKQEDYLKKISIPLFDVNTD